MKRVYLLCMAATLFAACTQDRTEEVDLSGKKIYASIEQNDASGRVQLNDKKQTVWNAGDQIVVYNSQYMSKYVFDGEDGDRSGSFSLKGYYLEMTEYEHGLADGEYAAFYSTDERYYPQYVSMNGASYLVFRTNIPQTVDYVKNSYGLKTNIMYGTSSDGYNFQFKNMVGYLRLSLTGEKKVKSIELSSPDNYILSGHYVIGISNPDICGWVSGASANQIINCGEEGVQLNASPTDFYFALTPKTFTNGIVVTITFTDGSLYQKSTSKTISIERNTIQPMAVIDTSVDPYTQKIYIYHTGTTVAGPVLDGASSMAAQISWGDGSYSLLNEFTSYDYTDGVESHVITVKAVDATSVTLDNCTGVTKLDLSNF